MEERDEPLKIKIRGIYATALTRFFLEQGLIVAQPSLALQRRLSGPDNLWPRTPADVHLRDQKNRQGLMLLGPEAKVRRIQLLLQPHLWDATLRTHRGKQGEYCLEMELPAISKASLDELRREVMPTVYKHHRFKIINSSLVDFAENVSLSLYPERLEWVSRELEEHLLWSKLVPERTLGLEHVKPDGELMQLSEGRIVQSRPGESKLVLKRTRFKGRGSYDGLNIDKQQGDYALTVLEEHSWRCLHDYYRADGRYIGRYVNINTPVEIYPDRIRYVDLEVDVAFWPNGEAQILDEQDLYRMRQSGHISETMYNRALEEAHLSFQKDNPFPASA